MFLVDLFKRSVWVWREILKFKILDFSWEVFMIMCIKMVKIWNRVLFVGMEGGKFVEFG